MKQSPVPDYVRRFLDQETTLSLATLGLGGNPQVADVYYVLDGEMSLYFISLSDSRHTTNIELDSRVAGTISARSTNWRNIKGVQLEGTCTIVGGRQRMSGWARYVVKYPFVLSDPALAPALAKVRLYRLQPHWIRWIDNSIRLGHSEEYYL